MNRGGISLTAADEMGSSQGDDGRYLYAVVLASEAKDLGEIGVDKRCVYMVPSGNLAAVVHACPPSPYDLKAEAVHERVLEHSYVLDVATVLFGTVLPFSFNVIVRGSDQTVEDWLSKNRSQLRDQLFRLKGHSEYSVQLYCDEEALRTRVAIIDEDTVDQNKVIENATRGSAYLRKRGFELKIKDAVSMEISKVADEMTNHVRSISLEMKVEGGSSSVPEQYKKMRRVANLTCLVDADKIGMLGSALDHINHMDGFSVRFSGPWAPFSFVRLKEIMQ